MASLLFEDDKVETTEIDHSNNGNFRDEQYTRRNARQWIGTIWIDEKNGIGLGSKEFHSKVVKIKELRKYVVQDEKCPKTGKLHKHFYLTVNKQCRLVPTFEKLFGLGWYRPAQNAKGSMRYCSKEETRIGGPWIYSVDPDEDFASEIKETHDWWAKNKKRDEEVKEDLNTLYKCPIKIDHKCLIGILAELEPRFKTGATLVQCLANIARMDKTKLPNLTPYTTGQTIASRLRIELPAPIDPDLGPELPDLSK